MRHALILLALAGLSACGEEQKAEPPKVAAKPAELTYDGGDYQDEAAKVAHGKRLAVILDCTVAMAPICWARTSPPPNRLMAP